mgnify:CR=1 FL=1
MDYRKEKDKVLVRIDKDEEILETLKKLCEKENINGAIFSGIGACSMVATATYIPEKHDFIDHEMSGMLEMVSLNGNICMVEGELQEHSHGLFSYLDENGNTQVLAGHLKSAVVGYTAEILLQPTEAIEKKFDDNVGIHTWSL